MPPVKPGQVYLMDNGDQYTVHLITPENNAIICKIPPEKGGWLNIDGTPNCWFMSLSWFIENSTLIRDGDDSKSQPEFELPHYGFRE